MPAIAQPMIPPHLVTATSAMLAPYRPWINPETLQAVLATPPDTSAAPVVPGRLLTVPQVAERLAIGQRTVWRMMQEGKLVAVRIGTSVRFREADIVALTAGLA